MLASKGLGLSRIRPSNNDEIGVDARLDRTPNTFKVHLGVNDLFALQLPAPLRKDLVLDVASSDAGMFVEFNGPGDVKGPAKSLYRRRR